MEEENSLIEQRRANLAALREKGIEPFANKFTPDETCAGAREKYEEGREVALAGRMTAFRTMGKSVFLDIRDGSDRMQVYAQKNTLGDEAFEVLKKLDLGDFIVMVQYILGYGDAPASMAGADINGDHAVNVLDLVLLANHLWGAQCERC